MDLDHNIITDKSIIIMDLAMLTVLSAGTILPVDYSYIHSMDKYILMSLYQSFIPVTAVFLAINSLTGFNYDRSNRDKDSKATSNDTTVTPDDKMTELRLDESVKVDGYQTLSSSSSTAAVWKTTLQYIAQFCTPQQKGHPSTSPALSNQSSFESPNIFDVSESELYHVKASPISNSSSPTVFNNNYVSGDLFTPVPKLSDAMSSLYNRMVSPITSYADQMNTEVQYDHYVNLFQDGSKIEMVNPMRRKSMMMMTTTDTADGAKMSSEQSMVDGALTVSFIDVDTDQHVNIEDPPKTPTADKELREVQPSTQRSGVEIMKAASKLSAPSSAIRLLYNKLRHSSKKTPKHQSSLKNNSISSNNNYPSAISTTTTTPIPEATAIVVPVSSSGKERQQGGVNDDSRVDTTNTTRDEDKSKIGATAISRLNLSITVENRYDLVIVYCSYSST